MGGDGELDHIVGGDALALVARVRQFGERQRVNPIHFLFSRGRIRRIDADETVSYLLYQHFCVQAICLALYYIEVLRESQLVAAAALV